MTNTIVRPALESDIPFIFDAWMKTVKGSLPYKMMPSLLFNKEMKKFIEKRIHSSSAFVLCDKEDESVLYSCLVATHIKDVPVVHFAYTKSIFWKMGLMKKLMSETFPDILEVGCVYTTFAPSLHSTPWYVGEKPFAAFLELKYGFLFNPFVES